MNNYSEEITNSNCTPTCRRGNGLLIAIVLYILLTILLSSFRAC